MLGHSSAYADLIGSSHTVVTKADLMLDGAVIYPDLPVTGGQVTVDRTAQVLRVASISLVDVYGDLVPDSPFQSLTPYGTEVKLYRGLQLLDGTPELIPLGVFRLSQTSIKDNSGALIDLSASDRSRTISRTKFTGTYAIRAGTNVADAVASLVQNRLPNVPMNITGTSHVTPALSYDAQADPWSDAIQTLATSIGFDAYFDVEGVFTFEPTADPSKQVPVLQLIEGPENVVTEIDTAYDDDPGYNGVIITGESTTNTTPAYGEAWDLNPESPTYFLGQYGRVPRFETSKTVTTNDQAQAMAAGLLLRELGVTVQREITMVPNPALEPADVVHLSRAASKVDENVVLDYFTIPLTVQGMMTCRTRAQSAAA
jgi:hypothetical protein